MQTYFNVLGNQKNLCDFAFLLRYWLSELEVAAEGIESLGFAMVSSPAHTVGRETRSTLKEPDSYGTTESAGPILFNSP